MELLDRPSQISDRAHPSSDALLTEKMMELLDRPSQMSDRAHPSSDILLTEKMEEGLGGVGEGAGGRVGVEEKVDDDWQAAVLDVWGDHKDDNKWDASKSGSWSGSWSDYWIGNQNDHRNDLHADVGVGVGVDGAAGWKGWSLLGHWNWWNWITGSVPALVLRGSSLPVVRLHGSQQGSQQGGAVKGVLFLMSAGVVVGLVLLWLRMVMMMLTGVTEVAATDSSGRFAQDGTRHITPDDMAINILLDGIEDSEWDEMDALLADLTGPVKSPVKSPVAYLTGPVKSPVKSPVSERDEIDALLLCIESHLIITEEPSPVKSSTNDVTGPVKSPVDGENDDDDEDDNEDDDDNDEGGEEGELSMARGVHPHTPSNTSHGSTPVAQDATTSHVALNPSSPVAQDDSSPVGLAQGGSRSFAQDVTTTADVPKDDDTTKHFVVLKHSTTVTVTATAQVNYLSL